MFGTPGQSPTGEVADSISGGGFSDYWPMPSWQHNAVQQYLSVATNIPAQQVRQQSEMCQALFKQAICDGCLKL